MVFNKNTDDNGNYSFIESSGDDAATGAGGGTGGAAKAGAKKAGKAGSGNAEEAVSGKPDTEGKRPYRLKARAKRQEEVHRRITQATVDLHRTVGPARTTVSEIAKRAGVRRATVYNHFPTDLELIDACSSHWLAANPPPDPSAWAGIADPARRTERALAAIYDYYDRARDMLENVLRDAALIPALDEINHRKFWPMLEAVGEELADAWGAGDGWGMPGEAKSGGTKSGGTKSGGTMSGGSMSGGATPELRATLATVLDFFTWQTLAGRGLSPDAAASLATRWVSASAGK